MRRFLWLMVLLAVRFNVLASVDDTLPQGVKQRFLLFPFCVRSPESSWGFGGAGAFFFKAKNNDETLRTSDISLIGLYTLRKQTVIVLNSTVFFPKEQQVFRFQASYSYYPDKFWGLGNNTDETAKEDYTLKQFFINPQIIHKFYRNFYAGISMELQNVTDFKYDSAGVFDKDHIYGKTGGLTSGVGILFTYDTRTNAYSPEKGIFAEMNATRFDKVLSSDFNFNSYAFDFRIFFPAGKKRVAAFQAFSKLTHGETPIRYLSALGGTEMMRGYYKGRYTDKNMLIFQGELRQFIYWRIGVAGFAGVGQVSDAVKNFSPDEFHYSYGGGIRLMLHRREKLNLRIDFGFGKQSHGVYVILKEAF
jgi:hypothetical protein